LSHDATSAIFVPSIPCEPDVALFTPTLSVRVFDRPVVTPGWIIAKADKECMMINFLKALTAGEDACRILREDLTRGI